MIEAAHPEANAWLDEYLDITVRDLWDDVA
jgi:hypothetical protein